MKISVRQERNIKTLVRHIIIVAAAAIVWAGCSSSKETPEEITPAVNGQSDTVIAAKPIPAPASKAVQPKPKPVPLKQKSQPQNGTQRFSVQADTVDVQHKKKAGSQPTSISVKASTPKKFYSVEIGAFRLQSNINRHRTELAQRFNLPVRVLFDNSINLTRVSVGTFSTRSFAIDFMKRMQLKYPGDYPDCWVSYWTK